LISEDVQILYFYPIIVFTVGHCQSVLKMCILLLALTSVACTMCTCHRQQWSGMRAW